MFLPEPIVGYFNTFMAMRELSVNFCQGFYRFIILYVLVIIIALVYAHYYVSHQGQQSQITGELYVQY